jgi:branched-chain amino acid transport system permease protein
MVDTLATYWAVYGNVALSMGTNMLLALSIYVTLSCGMLAMANAAFMGIGAYSAAYVTVNHGLPLPLALALGVVMPSAVAYVIGKLTLRLSGVYLAMATLGFGEVVRVGILIAEPWTGGALGLNGIPQLAQWWHVALAVFVTAGLLWRLRSTKAGRAFDAIREDEVAAGMMGVHVSAYKLSAFVAGAAIAGLAGGLNAHLTFFIGPQEYGFDRGVEILTMTVLGGITGPLGPIVGSAVMTVLPEALRFLSDFRLIVNGLALIIITLFLPLGIVGSLQSRRTRLV